MIRILIMVKRVAVAVVGLLLFAQLVPNIALACEGAALEFNKEGNGKFNESGGKTVSTQKFIFPSQTNGRNSTFVCTEVKVGGELVANSTTANVIPEEYAGCEEAESKEKTTTVTTSKCAYKYSITQKKAAEEFLGEMQIVNNGGTCKIELKTASKCKITVGGQSVPHSTATYKNFAGGTPKELEIKNSVEPLEYAVQEFAGCNGFTGNGSFTTGAYQGVFKLQHVFIQ